MAWTNTSAWAGAFVLTEVINRLAMISGTRSWRTLWLLPVALRIVASVMYDSWASCDSAAHHLEHGYSKRSR